MLELSLQKSVERTPYEDVIDVKGGPSPRGSTWWRRAQSCAREDFLANELRWEAIPRARALDTGLLWHGVLEEFYNAKRAIQQGTVLKKTPERIAFEFLQQFRDADGWLSIYELIGRMFDAYLERWRQRDDQLEIIGVEITLGFTRETHPEIFARFGFESTTRLDALVVDHSYSPVTRHLEHKSASALDPQTLLAYAQDDQLLGQTYLGNYFIDWTALGYPPYVGAIVNVTSKTKSPKCERLPIAPSDDQLTAWAEHKQYWQWQRSQYEALGWPRNYVNCTRRYGRCQFYDVCRQYPKDDVVTLRRKDGLGDLPPNIEKREKVIDLDMIGG